MKNTETAKHTNDELRSLQSLPLDIKIRLTKNRLREWLDVYPITASMASESSMRYASWLRHGCNVYDSNRPVSRPMSFWTDQDVIMYLKENNLPYCSVYGDIVEGNGKLKMSQCQRTGCLFCCFGIQCEKNPNRFQKLKLSHPVIYDYCMRPLEDGGLGIKNILERMNIKTE